MSVPYTPIDCNFYDVLLELATRRRSCAVVYVDDAGEEARVHARITDVFSRAGAEFLQLDSGETVRLDRLRSVDGRDLPAPPEPESNLEPSGETMHIPEAEYQRIAQEIASADSVVGIDAKKTHIMILHLLQDIQGRMTRLEERLERLEAVRP